MRGLPLGFGIDPEAGATAARVHGRRRGWHRIRATRCAGCGRGDDTVMSAFSKRSPDLANKRKRGYPWLYDIETQLSSSRCCQWSVSGVMNDIVGVEPPGFVGAPSRDNARGLQAVRDSMKFSSAKPHSRHADPPIGRPYATSEGTGAGGAGARAGDDRDDASRACTTTTTVRSSDGARCE